MQPFPEFFGRKGRSAGGVAMSHSVRARWHGDLLCLGNGLQRVIWCSDADADGCADEDVKRSIRIEWTGGRYPPTDGRPTPGVLNVRMPGVRRAS